MSSTIYDEQKELHKNLAPCNLDDYLQRNSHSVQRFWYLRQTVAGAKTRMVGQMVERLSPQLNKGMIRFKSVY